MISPIRRATEEEVKQIIDKSDLTSTSDVWVWDNDKAVTRLALEIDPVHFAPTSGSQRKALFFWGLLNMTRVTGAREIYFNIDAEGTEDYQNILEKMGAQKTTTAPQYRYKLVL